MKSKTNVKAGGMNPQHNQVAAKTRVKAGRRPDSSGSTNMGNHNQTCR